MGFVAAVSLLNLICALSEITILLFSAALCSILGDAFMARYIHIHSNRIVNGAVAFGLAHLQYIYVLILISSGISQGAWLAIAVITIAAFFVIAYSNQSSKTLLVIVFIYIALLATLLTLAVSILLTRNLTARWLVFIGVLLFVASDATIGINEFRAKLPFAFEFIAITYIGSQMLLQAIPLAL